MDPRDLIWGNARSAIEDRLRALDPELARYVGEFAYGELYARGGLEPRIQELIAISALTALGSPPELITHFKGALRAGASETEIRETLLFLIPFLGFPRVIAAFERLKESMQR